MTLTDLDANYASNTTIKYIIFKGETLPGDNTMPNDELVTVKTMIDGIINSVNQWTTNYTPASGDLTLQNIFLRLFRAFIKDEEMVLTDREFAVLTNEPYATPAIVCPHLGDDFDEPSSV